MSFRLNSLGLKLNLALLLFFLVVGVATAAVVYFGFSRTRENANTRSREALEELGERNLQEIANSQASLGALQLEWAAEIGQRAGQYMQSFKASGATAPYDVSRLVLSPRGLWIDPDPNRPSDVVVLPQYMSTPGALDDLAYAASLNAILPALISGFPREIADESFHPTAITYVSVNGTGMYYPPRGSLYETVPLDIDLANIFDDVSPEKDPERKTLWTSPYQDVAGQGLVITALTPVYEGDTLRGRFEVDLRIDNLSDTVNQIKPTENGFAFYVDVEGKILRTDAYDLLTNELQSQDNQVLASLVQRMQAGEHGVERVRMGGDDFFVAFAPVTGVGGGFGVVAPVSELTDEAAAITAGIDHQADQTMTVVLSSMAALFAIALVGATYLNRRVLLRPIEALVAGTRAVAEGDLESKIAVRGDDELATLGHSFNLMTSEILQRAESLRQEVRERQAAQEELRALFAAMTDRVIVFDRGGRVTRLPDTNAPDLGIARDELPGMTLHDIVPEEQAERVLQTIQRALRERITVTEEYPYVVGEDTYWFSSAFSPISDDEVVMVARDITEVVNARTQIERQRDALEQEVREREAAQEELRALFAAMNDVVIVFDADGRCLRIAPTSPDLLYSQPEETVGRTLHEIMPADQADDFVAAIRSALGDGEAKTIEYPMVIGERQLWFAATISPMSEDSVVYVARDITDRVNARQELERQVQERTQELRALLDVSANVASTLELEPLLNLVIEQIGRVVDHWRATLFLVRDGGLLMVSSRVKGTPEAAPLTGRRLLTLDELQPVWRELSAGRAVIIDDVRDGSEMAAVYQRVAGGRAPDPEGRTRSNIAVPLVYKERTIGMITVAHEKVAYYTADHVRLLSAIASQAAIAVENARLYEQVQARSQEMQTLFDVSRNVASTLELRPLLQTIIEHLKDVADYSRCSVFVLEGDSIVLLDSQSVASADAVALRIPLDMIRPLWDPIASGQPVIVDDVRGASPEAAAYRRGSGDLLETAFRNIHSWMGVPLESKDRLIGMLTLSHDEVGFYNDHHASLVTAIATQVAVAIENAQLYEQVQARSQELATLLSVSRNVASTLELRPLLELIIDQLKQIVDFSRCSIFELEDETMVILDSRANFTDMPLDMRFEVGELGPIWERMSRGEPVVVDDVHGDSVLAQAYRHAAGARMQTYAFQAIHSALGVALTSKDRIIGMLVLTHMQPAYYTERHAGLVSAIATQVAVAIDNARLYEQAQQLAAVEERQRLARELHDSVSQALYGIALGARTARTLLDRDPAKVVEPVEYVLSLAEAGLAEMRALIFELRPESLEIEGLVAALDKQVAATAARYGIEVTSELIEEPEMSLAQKEIFYRIGQEALHNVVKHARASKASVRLARDNRSFVLEVTDNGVGFEAGQSFPGHMGLVSMSERAQSIGAQLEVESAPGKGTKVKLRAGAASEAQGGGQSPD